MSQKSEVRFCSVPDNVYAAWFKEMGRRNVLATMKTNRDLQLMLLGAAMEASEGKNQLGNEFLGCMVKFIMENVENPHEVLAIVGIESATEMTTDARMN